MLIRYSGLLFLTTL